MKRLIFTLLVSVSSFAAIASFGAPDARSDATSLDRRGGAVLPGGRLAARRTPFVTRPRRPRGLACQPGCAEDRARTGRM